jgi:hypothetical protein
MIILVNNFAVIVTIGLGSNIQTQHHVQKNSVENSSIYVCGLSPDLTEKDLGEYGNAYTC